MEGKLTEDWQKKHGNEIEPASVLLDRILKERREKWEAEQLEQMRTKGKMPKDDKWKNKYKEPSEPDTSKLPELSEGWVWTTVGVVGESIKNGIYKPKQFYTDDGIACLRMYNIEDGAIVWKDIKRMNLTKEEIKKYELIPGDILVNRVNSRELVGKAAPIPHGLEPCVYESKNIRLRLFAIHINSKYVGFWFRFFSQKHFSRNAQQTVGMASINQKQLSTMALPLPPSLKKSNVVSLLPMQSKRLLMPNSNALMRSVNLSSSRRSLANWFHKIPMMSQQKNCLSVLKKKKLNGKPCRRPTAKPKSNWRYLSIEDA